MSKPQRSSTNGERDPFSRGFVFWSKNQFWENPESGVTEKGKQYFRESLARMQQTDRVLSRIDETIL